MSISLPGRSRRHRSISVRTADGSERTYCGLQIDRDRITRDWRQPDCKSCLKRMKS